MDRLALWLLIGAALVLAARAWLDEHPQHNPWAPLDLNEPPGWATQRKLTVLRADVDACRAVLERSGVDFRSLPAAGEGACARPDRTVLADAPLAPANPVMTCPVAAGLHVWLAQGVQPAAADILGSRVARIEHLGTFNCRRIGGGAGGNWSEHATGNAIDIAAFVLEDGRRISLLRDWDAVTAAQEPSAPAAFLRAARDAACPIFGTVLGPDYNAAHADHVHLDQAGHAFGGICR